MQTYANYAKPGVHQVQTYRGIKRGWANVGRPISKEEALQLCKWASTVSPNFNHRVRINPIELFPCWQWGGRKASFFYVLYSCHQMKINPLRSNQTELIFDDGAKVLFSYETPVDAYVPKRGYIKTSKKWSQTTSRHVNSWCPENALSVPQREISALVKGVKRWVKLILGWIRKNFWQKSKGLIPY